MGTPGCVNKRAGGKKVCSWFQERVCIWSVRKTLTLPSWRPWGQQEVRRRWWRPTARCKQEKKRQYTVKQLDFVKVMFLEETPAVLSLGELCEDHGYTYHWISGQKPHLTRNGKRIDCKTWHHVPFVVLGLSASSSSTTPSPTSPSSSSQASVFDVNRYTENPVPERSGTTSEVHRRDPLHESTETENKIKKRGTRRSTEQYITWIAGLATGIQREFGWWKYFNRALRKPRARSQDTSKSSHELPMEPRAKVEPGSGEHGVYTHFPNDPNFDICLETKITRANCRRRTGTVVPERNVLVTWSQRITKFSVKKVNRVTIIDMPWWHKTWQHSGYNHTRGTQKLPRRPRAQEVPGADEETKSHLHWQFLGIWQSLWRSFLESLYVKTTDQKQMGFLKEQYAEWKKVRLLYCCNQVWMRNGGQIPRNVTAICEMFKISCMMGRHPMKGGSECPSTDHWYRLEQLSNYHPVSAKDQSRLHQFGAKVLPGIFLGYALYAGRIWKGDIVVADIEELEWMDASEIYARRLNAKEVLSPQKSGIFVFTVADGTVKIFGRERRLRTSTLTRERPERGEEQEFFQGKSDELHSPTPLQEDSTLDDEEAENDFWTFTGEFIYRHHVEPRVELYMPTEESFPSPLKYIDVTRTTHTSLVVLLEKQI